MLCDDVMFIFSHYIHVQSYIWTAFRHLCAWPYIFVDFSILPHPLLNTLSSWGPDKMRCDADLRAYQSYGSPAGPLDLVDPLFYRCSPGFTRIHPWKYRHGWPSAGKKANAYKYPLVCGSTADRQWARGSICRIYRGLVGFCGSAVGQLDLADPQFCMCLRIYMRACWTSRIYCSHSGFLKKLLETRVARSLNLFCNDHENRPGFTNWLQYRSANTCKIVDDRQDRTGPQWIRGI